MALEKDSTLIRVLYVDDSKFDRDLVRDALEREATGFTVREASSREQFDAHLAEGGFDVVITDFNILGFTGSDVIRAVRKNHPQVPVIVVTGTGSEEIAVEAMKLGASDYVIKNPRHIRRLAGTIQNVLAHHNTHRLSLDAFEQLKHKDARLKMAMAAAHMGAFEWNMATGSIVWEEGHERLFGLDPGTFDGKYETFASRVHPDDLPEVEKQLRAAMEMRRVYQHTYRVVLPGGAIRWISGRGEFTYNAANEPVGMNGVVMDVTPQREAEERTRQQQAQLAHVLRLNLMSQLASGLAHEINQPLSAISNFSGAAIRLYEDSRLTPTKAAEILSEINAQAHRAGEIIRHMRSFMQKKMPELKMIDLNSVISEAIALLSSEFVQHRVRVAFEPAARLPKMAMHAVQIQQVMVNLIHNAIEAMDETPANARVIRISTVAAIEQVIIRVSDSGSGIAEQDLPKIFESFYSTKSTGLGMGLNISRSIIESHGGSLTAYNNPNAGTTFEFVLPIAGGTA